MRAGGSLPPPPMHRNARNGALEGERDRAEAHPLLQKRSASGSGGKTIFRPGLHVVLAGARGAGAVVVEFDHARELE